MRHRLFIFAFCLNITFFTAQKDGTVPLPQETAIVDSIITAQDAFIKSDSVLKSPYTTENSVSQRKFELNYKRKYRGSDFSYETIKPKESLWSRIKRRFAKIWESIFGKPNPKTAGNVTEIILWLLAIVTVAVILYYGLNYIANRQGNFFFGKRNRKVDLHETDILENIHEINFPENILKFEKERDYRSAVRFQFLFVLKKLSDRKLIDWNAEKTNKDYLAEMKNSEQKKQFRELVRIFDYVWYGEFEINENSYLSFREKFTGFII